MLIAFHGENSAPHTWCHSPGSLGALCGRTRPNASHTWLVTNATMFSLLSTCDLAFPNLLCSLPSCVLEGSTVSTRTSLSNFKRAQFPSKTCTRTDYSLLAWFFKSPVGILVLFCFVFIFSLLPHYHCRGRETARTPEWHFRSPRLYSVLLNFHQRNMNKITQETSVQITQSPDRKPSLEYLVSKVEKTITQFKRWVHETPCQVEDWEMQRRARHIRSGKVTV